MDVSNIAELNTFLVLDAIRSGGSAARRRLGRDLGLSGASVSRIVRRLLASGLIEELPGAGTGMRSVSPTVFPESGFGLAGQESVAEGDGEGVESGFRAL